MPLAERDELRRIIDAQVLVKWGENNNITNPRGLPTPWLFDFRALLLDGEFLDKISDVFWEIYKDAAPFQVGGLESASIPLVTAIILKSKKRGTPINGFYIRKSRKPHGMQKIVEGKLTSEPVILVDDLINTGGTFIKEVEILASEGAVVSKIFTIVRFQNIDEYSFLKEKNIELTSLFSISEFGLHLTLTPLPRTDVFSIIWTRQSSNPNYSTRVPKSAPVIDAQKIYFGSDNGHMRALSQEDGSEIWRFKIYGLGFQGKTILSSPALYKNTIYFGAYDGNFYAVDSETGKKKWIYGDADWIGSSPCVAEDKGIVYVGLEYGLWKKRGGIVALNAQTGEKQWDYTFPGLTHGSPAYSKKYNLVVIGSNDGGVYCFQATNGKLLWKIQTGAEVRASLSFDERRGYIVFGSFDRKIYVVSAKDGNILFSYETGAGIYTTPLLSESCAYVAGLDKKVYCLNLDTFSMVWTFEATGRIFSSPVFAQGMLYIGSNDGRLYELDPATGRNTAFFQTTERITNKIAFNKNTGRFFMPTYANEMYCLERNPR